VSLGSRQFDKPFRAISLCDNQAVITAIANDDGYENIFLQQLQTLAKAGDTIVCISASGNSKNLIKAIEYAKERMIFCCWFDCLRWGLSQKKIVILNIHIPTKVGEYGPAEDLHMVVCGLVGSYFRKKFLMLELDAWLEIAKSAALEGGNYLLQNQGKELKVLNGFRSRY
jgi:D-sedoheptulose 7-phosphate isomerase